MKNNSEILVDIPRDKGVHIKKAGAKNEKYVYKYVKHFRNNEGKPRHTAKTIGKVASVPGKMCPNSNYYELYQVDPLFADVDFWDYGYSYLVLKISRTLGLFECLENTFGETRALDIIIMAAYIIREGGSMDSIDDWQNRNYFAGSRLLTSQSTSRIFGTLTAGQINNFFKQWLKTAESTGTVCYDVTSVSSYASGMTSVERGYNRDGENLSQFNLGIFCDEITRVPLYYNRYNGSLTDKANLSCVLANARDVGINRVKMVADGGFWNDDCLTAFAELCDAFTVGMPIGLAKSQEILTAYGDEIDNYGNQIATAGTYCVSHEAEINGISGKILLYFDAGNHVNLCNELSERINRMKAELSKLKRYPKNHLRRFEQFFKITKREKGGGFDYEVDFEKVEKLRKIKGFYLIFTTDIAAAPDEILRHYRAKDVVEKLFDQIKCDMDGNRIRTHNEQTTDGKVFVTFIACIIRSHLLYSLNQYFTDNSTSLKKVFNLLSNITVISGSNGFRFTKALTKKQKDILKHFNADSDILTSLLS